MNPREPHFVGIGFDATARTLDPVKRFLNSRRLEEERDSLSTSEQAAQWFADEGYASLVADEWDLRIYRMARESIRDALIGRSEASERLEIWLNQWANAVPTLRRVEGSWMAGLHVQTVSDSMLPLQDVSLALWKAAAEGELDRLKICADVRCQLAFYDRSRNRSRMWCTPAGCGNRIRVERHRTKLHATSPAESAG